MASTLYDSVTTKASLVPAVRTDGTANGTAVDLGTLGNDYAMVVISTGTLTDGSIAITIEDSDNGSTGWASVPAGNIQGTVPTIAATADNTIYEIGVTPAKRYLRVVAVTSGATLGGAFGAVVVLGSPVTSPLVRS